MVTVFDYYHGEEGEVVHRHWMIGKRRLIYSMQLRGNPHRAFVLEHTSSDIAIDPLLKPGDKTVFVRLGRYSAIWVKKGDEFHPEVEQAIERAREKHRRFFRYENIVSFSRFLATLYVLVIAARKRIPVRLREPVEKPPALPTTPVKVFLSYRRSNVLLAHEFYNKLKREAKVDVWIDQERQRTVLPEHELAIASWLQQAIDSCQVFMVLLTEESVTSSWVKNEIVWATEKAKRENGFHLIVLKLGQVEIPDFARKAQYVLDSKSLSYHEIVEELYAAVYQRRGRREWLEHQRARGWPGFQREERRFFNPPLTGCGKAISLDWTRTEDTINWTLEYEKDGRKERVTGSGQTQVVDLGIRPGDLIGFLHSHRRTHMRSGDPGLTADDVFQNYTQQLPRRSWDEASRPLAARIGNLILFVCGLLIIGLIEYFYFRYLFRYFVTELAASESPDSISARNFTIVATVIVVEFAAYMLIRGLNQVIFYARPSEFGNRSGKTAFWYSVQASVFLGTKAVLDSILNIVIFWIVYALTVGLIIILFQPVFGDVMLAYRSCAVIGYCFCLLIEAVFLWDLIREARA